MYFADLFLIFLNVNKMFSLQNWALSCRKMRFKTFENRLTIKQLLPRNNFDSKGASRKHLRTKVTPDFHLTYSKNGGNLGSESK